MLLAVLALASCGTPNIDKDYTLDAATGKGVVIGSITYTGFYGRYRVFYRQVGGGAEGFFNFGESTFLLPPMTKDDIRAPALRGNVFAAALPAGDYEIYGWQVDSGNYHVRPRNPVSVLYHVEPGKSVYLGNFYFQRREKFLGATTGVTVTYKDESERDLNIFAAKYPQPAQFPIASSIERGRVYDDLGEGWTTSITIPIYVPVR
ncbi:MAG: hypothetical protein ACM30I_14300 [Gemmatimonas sp.]